MSSSRSWTRAQSSAPSRRSRSAPRGRGRRSAPRARFCPASLLSRPSRSMRHFDRWTVHKPCRRLQQKEESDGQTGDALHGPVGRPATGGARAGSLRGGASTASSSPAGATTSRSTGRLPTPATAAEQRELLERHGLRCFALGAHLVGQAVCDPIDARHQAILPPEVWGDGDPGGGAARGRPSG